jgi:hypothetical protein
MICVPLGLVPTLLFALLFVSTLFNDAGSNSGTTETNDRLILTNEVGRIKMVVD